MISLFSKLGRSSGVCYLPPLSKKSTSGQPESIPRRVGSRIMTSAMDEDVPLLHFGNVRLRSRSYVALVVASVGATACLAGSGVVKISVLRDALGQVWQGVNGVLLAPAPQVLAGPNAHQRTFTMYDHCVDERVIWEGFDREFWQAPRAGVKIVRHNYGTPNFFDLANGIELQREEYDDGLYA